VTSTYPSAGTFTATFANAHTTTPITIKQATPLWQDYDVVNLATATP